MMTERLDRALQDLAELLIMHAATVCTVESCTGGWVSAAMTALPGSSHWFERGWVVYSNLAKQELLGVDAHLIDQVGAVSQPVVAALLQGALQRSRVDYALAVSGIAGPSGGSAEKPVGTVWMGVQRRNQPANILLGQFTGNRQDIRLQAVETVVELLLQSLRMELSV